MQNLQVQTTKKIKSNISSLTSDHCSSEIVSGSKGFSQTFTLVLKDNSLSKYHIENLAKAGFVLTRVIPAKKSMIYCYFSKDLTQQEIIPEIEVKTS